VIEYTSSANQYVYHYTKASTALNHILKDGVLRFASYTGTNDPKETKAWEFGLLTSEDRDLGKYKHNNLSGWFSRELKSQAKLACFSMDTPPLTGDHMADLFRRGFTKARMWAQYAENHTGVCLVFDREELLTDVKKHFGNYPLLHGNVLYRNRDLIRGMDHHEYMLNIDAYESLGPKACVRSHIQIHHRSLFFEKLNDWRDEAEWRAVLLTESQQSLYLPIKKSLVAVIHGDATDPDTSELMMSATKSWNIEHMGLSWKNSTPWYDHGSFGWIPGKITRPRRLPTDGA
jgi:hypothetical protein